MQQTAEARQFDLTYDLEGKKVKERERLWLWQQVGGGGWLYNVLTVRK